MEAYREKLKPRRYLPTLRKTIATFTAFGPQNMQHCCAASCRRIGRRALDIIPSSVLRASRGEWKTDKRSRVGVSTRPLETFALEAGPKIEWLLFAYRHSPILIITKSCTIPTLIALNSVQSKINLYLISVQNRSKSIPFGIANTYQHQ